MITCGKFKKDCTRTRATCDHAFEREIGQCLSVDRPVRIYCPVNGCKYYMKYLKQRADNETE